MGGDHAARASGCPCPGCVVRHILAELPLTLGRERKRESTNPRRHAMAYSRDSKSAKVRTQLTHPVIDGDGHWLEPIPLFLDYLRQVAGLKMTGAVEKFMKKASDTTWYDISP